jgi:hypothetical protein
MTWPDFVTIGLCIVMGMVESKRGFVPAFFAMVGAILTVEIASGAYRSLFPGLTYCQGYVATVLIGFVIVGVATFLLKRYAPTDIGSFDSPLAGVAGIVTGIVIAHAMYGAVILGYAGGTQAPVYANSAFAGSIYELRGWHGFMNFMGRVGTTRVAEPSAGS